MVKTKTSARNLTALGGWQLISVLGRGGNGEVYRAEKDGAVGALKRLSQRHATSGRTTRFQDEVQALRSCADIPGVLPVLAADLAPRGTQPWFVMGLAVPITEELSDRPTLKRVVEAMRDIGTVLQTMHARGFLHRDIKPENLFFREGMWTVGDFGLVSFEGKTSETEVGERIGPIYYIAPEMLNSALKADGRCADVFSLAKTLWVLATGQRFPLPGVYDASHEAFRIGSYIASERTLALDKLIASATMFSPTARPTMSQVVAELTAWLQPQPQPSMSLSFDISAFATELTRRKAENEVERDRQQRASDFERAVGERLRESLRPFAREIESGLSSTEAFDSVNLGIDNHHWGFSLQATIPGGKSGPAAIIKLGIWVNLQEGNFIQVWARINLDVRTKANYDVLLWDKKITFLEGGSEEALLMDQLCGDVREAMQKAVIKSLEIAIGGAGQVVQTTQYLFEVTDPEGLPIGNADILLIGADGVYLRSTTGLDGSAQFGPTPIADPVAFVAHVSHPAEAVSQLQHSTRVVLQSQRNTGSLICTSNRAQVKGLLGSISLIHDQQDRTYMYAENIAIDGGEQQPVNVELGRPTRLQSIDGAAVAIIPRAVRGHCFLLDVAPAQS